MDEEATIEQLTERVAVLEALVDRLASVEATPAGAPALPTTPPEPGDRPSPTNGPLPRRQLIGRAGVAAVGAVLGGTVATVAAASPAAAATGSFDTSTSDPALTATTSGTGSAIKTSSTSSVPALEVSGGSQFTGPVQVLTNGGSTALQVMPAPGSGSPPTAGIIAAGSFIGLQGNSGSIGVMGDAASIGVVGIGRNGYGVIATGKAANLMLRTAHDTPPMPPPSSTTSQHWAGEIYLDDSNDLWLCVADGTPGTWEQLNLAPPAPVHGLFTVLRQPVRVYDSATAGGPFTGTRHGIDLTARASGLPTDATAAVVNVGITNTLAQTNSYLKVYADDLTTPPPTTAIRWRDAKELLSATITTRVTAAKLAVQINGTANLTIDVIAYYR